MLVGLNYYTYLCAEKMMFNPLKFNSYESKV